MNFKKILTLFLIAITLLTTGFEVYAETYSYGYYYSEAHDDGILDHTHGYWNPANQTEIQTDGFWYDDKLIFTVNNNNEIVLQEDNTQYYWPKTVGPSVDNIFDYEVTELGNSKYRVNIDGNYADESHQKFEGEMSSRGFLYALDDLFKFLGDSFIDFRYEIEVEFDMSHLTKYYNDYKKMPEVIVVCQYTDNTFNRFYEGTGLAGAATLIGGYLFPPAAAVGSLISVVITFLSGNAITLSQEIVYYYDDFNAPETFDIKPEFKLAGPNESRVSCYYYAQNPGADLNVCYSFKDGIENLKKIANNYTCDSKKFQNAYADMETKCDKYLTKNGVAIETTDGTVIARNCSESCRGLANRKAEICGGYVDGYRCGAIGIQLAAWLMKILKIIRYIVPVIIIILSTLDFIGAIGSSNDDAMKKASQKLTKRIIAAIILFLLPLILQFLFDVFKIQGLESGNPFCVK